MRTAKRLAKTLLAGLTLIPIGVAGQERPVAHELAAIAATAAPIEVAAKPVTIQLPMRDEARAQIEAAMAPSSHTNITLTIGGIEYDNSPGVYYEVYVGLPKNEVPSYKNQYFVGNLAFFVPHGHGAEHAAVRSFNITKAVRALKSFKSWNGAQLSVTFVMRGLEDREGRQLPVSPGTGLRFNSVKLLAVR